MRKTIFLLTILVMSGAAARAELAVSAKLNALWDVFQYVKPAPANGVERDALFLNGLGRPDGYSYEAILSFDGAMENKRAGFTFQVYQQNGLSLVARGWLKPFNWMRIEMGKLNMLELQILPEEFYPLLSHYLLSPGGDDDIFTKFGGESSVLLSFTPLDGLFAGLCVRNLPLLNMGEGEASFPRIGAEEMRYTFQRAQAALAYTISGIGAARVQYYGNNPDVHDSSPHTIYASRMEAAFAYTGVKDLIIDLGAKYVFLLQDPEIPASRTGGLGRIPIPAPTAANSVTPALKTLAGRYQAPQQVSLGASYRLNDAGPGTLRLRGRFDSKFFGWYEEPGKNIVRMGPEFKVSVWPSYEVNNTVFILESTLVYGGDWVKRGKTLYTGGFSYSAGLAVEQKFAGNHSITAGLTCSGGEGLLLPGTGSGAVYTNTAQISSPTESGKLPLVVNVPIKLRIRF